MLDENRCFEEAPLQLASRASQLAMAQAKIVCAALAPAPAEVCSITTRGDRILDRSLIDAGGKGLFIKELERSLLSNDCDLAVHSMKDMETHFAPDTEIGAVLAREDRRDALIGHYKSLWNLPKGARIGTASVRRGAILLYHRPDLQIKLLRGNINRRLDLLAKGEFDAIILAVAGLKRINLDVDYNPIEPEIMPPAVAQGVLALQIRTPFNDRSLAVKNIVKSLNCDNTLAEVTAERALLAYLDGSCQTPISASATLDKEEILRLDGMILLPDGSAAYRAQMTAPRINAVALGKSLGAKLLEMAGGRGFLV